MSKDGLTLSEITNDVKLILEKLKLCQDNDAIAVLIYGIYCAQKKNKDITLEEALQSSIDEWLDVF